MRRYVLLTTCRGNHFNIYDTEIQDTTGGFMSIIDCLHEREVILSPRYDSLQDFMSQTAYKTILAEFNSFETFHLEFPELLI